MELTPTSLQKLYSQGRFADVVKAAANLDITPDSDPEVSLLIAASLLQLGHLQQCLQVCGALQGSCGSNPQYLSLYAICLRRVGQLEKSESVFKHALSQFPDLPYLNNNYANLLIEKGDIAAARHVLEEVLASHPDYQDARVNLQSLKALPAAADPLQASNVLAPTEPEPGQASQAASIKFAGSAPDHAAAPLIDPLQLAFSEEEVEVDRRERSKRKAELAERNNGNGQGKASLPDLPAAPIQPLLEEIAKAGTEALIEKQPNAALALAEILNEHGGESRLEAMSIAAEAYLMLKQYARAETTLLSLASLGYNIGSDNLLNIVGLALQRKDIEQACHFLERARKLDPESKRISKFDIQIDALKKDKMVLSFNPYPAAAESQPKTKNYT